MRWARSSSRHTSCDGRPPLARRALRARRAGGGRGAQLRGAPRPLRALSRGARGSPRGGRLTRLRAPAGKTYEAWVIREGKAKPAGLFRGRAGTSIVELGRQVPPGSLVAVTLERAGGVPQPTTKP